MLLHRRRTVDLRRERNRRRLSLRVAARSIGVSAATLQRAEDGHRVNEHSAYLISDFYAVSVASWFPRLKDEPPS